MINYNRNSGAPIKNNGSIVPLRLRKSAVYFGGY